MVSQLYAGEKQQWPFYGLSFMALAIHCHASEEEARSRNVVDNAGMESERNKVKFHYIPMVTGQNERENCRSWNHIYDYSLMHDDGKAL